MISVCIPWAGNDLDRARALNYVTRRYSECGYNVYVGTWDPDRWRKGVAVRKAIAETSDDLLVIADADVWSDHLTDAISAVQDGAGWATPHWQVCRLTQDGTQRFYAGERGDLPLEEEHHGLAGGGIVVLHRDLYEQVPIDERFVGWGGEDKAWAYALRTLAGRPVRVQQPLWHFWHPPQQRLTRAIGSVNSDLLRARYADAVRQPRLMRALIAEGRAWASSGSSSKT